MSEVATVQSGATPPSPARARSGTGRWARLAVIPILLGGLATALAWGSPANESVASLWSAAATLGCTRPSGPAVAFPSRSPFAASGPGAIVWSGSASGCRSPGGVSLAPLGVADLPGPARGISGGAVGVIDAKAVTTTGNGRTLIGVHLPGGVAAVTEAVAGSPFSAPVHLNGPPSPVALASSYVGDAAVASLTARPGHYDGLITVRRQGRDARRLGGPTFLTHVAAPVTALALNLDYRGDAIAAWQQQGAIYARELHTGGQQLGPIQRVGPSGPRPALAATISDDGRAIVAWLSQPAAGLPTVVYLAISGPRVTFGAPRLVEAFSQPPGFQLDDGALRLVRLANEGVMLAWTGITSGRYAVRAAPVSLNGARPATTVSDPGSDAVLAGLATGPRGEVLAIWRSAPRLVDRLDATRQSLVAARGFVAGAGPATFEPPEQVTSSGPNVSPAVAIDPATDRAVAAWRAGGVVRYAVRAAGARGL